MPTKPRRPRRLTIAHAALERLATLAPALLLVAWLKALPILDSVELP